MAPNLRIANAFRAMKDLGITEERVKPVLKNLIKVYQKNWNFIEEDNYQALVDAIFEKQEEQVAQPENKNQNESDALVTETKKKRRDAEREANDEAEEYEQPDQPLKRLRLRYQEDHVCTSSSHSNPRSGMSSKYLRPHNRDNSQDLLKVKDEPPTDNLPSESSTPVPLCTEQDLGGNNLVHEFEVLKTSPFNSGKAKEGTNGVSINVDSSSELEVASVASGKVKLSVSCIPSQGRPNFHVPSLDELFKRTEEKCLQSYKFLDPSFSVRKILNKLCECALELGTPLSKGSDLAKDVRSSDKISGKVTPAATEVVADEPLSRTECANMSDTGQVEHLEVPYLSPTSTGMGQSPQPGNGFTGKRKGIGEDEGRYDLETNQKCPTNSDNIQDGVLVDHSDVLYLPPSSHEIFKTQQSAKDFTEKGSIVIYKEHSDIEKGNCQSLIPLNTQDPTYVVKDISKGLESVVISLVNEVDNEPPPVFCYIPSNIKFQNADVSCSLARMGDSCCSACIGDCALNPCACGNSKTGVVYTLEGLLKEDFLEACMSMNPDSRNYSYCKDCPLERSKEEDEKEGCKGHLMRNFIKECWWRCGCNGRCGNRVVQRGMKRNLQVFMTAQGKGWGLRTLEHLPKGAFVCEFAGEILMVKELHSRISESSSKHEFPVLLDADWRTRVVKDEQVLCLDATYYGNVARFINHRCIDANLIGIPVEVDTPERLYYRFAFFTTRNIDAFEELNWDYGIDYNNHGNKFKEFECLCESKSCQSLRRKTRSRSAKKRR